jgi:ABC-type thiamine transport system ATPase subunit
LDAGLNLQQVLLGGVEQRPPFACAFVGEQWIAAGDEPFAGIIG